VIVRITVLRTFRSTGRDDGTSTEDDAMNGNNEWLEKKVDEMLADLRRSEFWDSGIDEARHLQRTYGYVWDVALKISCDYWCK
jgi:hypothetical protein